MVKKISEYKYERADLKKAAEYYDNATTRVKQAKSARELADIRAEVNEYFAQFVTQINLAFIRHSLDVRDEFYAAEKDYYDENLPALSAKSTQFNSALMSSPYAGELDKVINPIIVQNTKASLRVMDEKIIADCIEENKLVTEYDKLLASLAYPWEGKTVTLSEMHGFCKDADRNVRKKAFTVIGQTLATVGDKLDDIYDRMVKVRTAMARKMGFDNFVEMGDLRIGHIGYGRKEIAVFRNSVLNDVVPALKKLKSELAERLGLKGGIHLYDNDNYIVGGNIDPVGNAEQLFAAAQNIYDDMDPALGKFFNDMCAAQAIDYVAREGKMGGGYAEMLYDFGQPFIFANFNGTMDDVGVLTHEFGHAYAFNRAAANNVDIDLFVGGMETAETHSMSMEALCNSYNKYFYGDRAVAATYQQIFDAFNFLPYGVTVDYFQQLVYENPDMTPAERRALWLKLEGEFRPYVDMSDIPFIEGGGRWQYQKHIYESPFYYIDYCLSTCLALQFGELAAVDFKTALKKYLNLVEAGGTKSIVDLAHEAGLKSPFDEGALSDVCKQIVAHLTKLQKEIK
ncbi:MAG: M3 family oligoendopeptidase [Clostridiales bacterium]|nr:M3 family oligoendopeptidase [Clostridiales bacterium]